MKLKNKAVNHLPILAAGLTLLIFMMSACQPTVKPGARDVSQLQVTVSILPQAYFVERIAGDVAFVNVMVGPGEEPHTYEPKPNQMKALSDSQIFFTIGTEYEDAWLPRFLTTNPELTIIDSAAGIQRLRLSESHHHEDQPGDEEAHVDDFDTASNEYGLDPHVWLAPNNGKVIALNILNALIIQAPEQADTFQDNFETLIADIDALDTKIRSIFEGVDQRAFMVFHPAWGYFADQYNLEQIAIQIGGQEPSASEMADLIAIARAEKIQVIFIQPTFSTANAMAIAQEINAEIVVVDPLARNWLENLENVTEAFATALSK